MFSRFQCWLLGHDFVLSWCNRCGTRWEDTREGRLRPAADDSRNTRLPEGPENG